jgi:hypothetical protein
VKRSRSESNIPRVPAFSKSVRKVTDLERRHLPILARSQSSSNVRGPNTPIT